MKKKKSKELTVSYQGTRSGLGWVGVHACGGGWPSVWDVSWWVCINARMID